MRGSIVGIEDGLSNPKPGNWHGLLLELLDNLYASFVIGPLVVGYWRGTWNLAGEYIYPQDLPTSLIVSLSVGVIGHLIFNIFQATLRRHLNADKHRLLFFFGSRLYTEIYGTICVNTWRGGWEMINLYGTHDVLYVVLITLGCALLLAMLKGLRNVTASPFVVVNDSRREYFDIPTYFKLTVSKWGTKLDQRCNLLASISIRNRSCFVLKNETRVMIRANDRTRYDRRNNRSIFRFI